MNKHILVIDDNILLADMVSRWLRANSYAVTTVYSGEEAFSLLKVNGYDLILCDIHMEGKDGFAVLAACKAMYPKTKVIICSGDNAPEVVSMAFERGADSFLAKPLMIDELWHQVGLCLGYTPKKWQAPDQIQDDAPIDRVMLNAKGEGAGVAENTVLSLSSWLRGRGQ